MTHAHTRISGDSGADRRAGEIGSPSQFVGLSIAVDHKTLEAIDRSAQASGLTRSGFLALTLRKAVGETL